MDEGSDGRMMRNGLATVWVKLRRSIVRRLPTRSRLGSEHSRKGAVCGSRPSGTRDGTMPRSVTEIQRPP